MASSKKTVTIAQKIDKLDAQLKSLHNKEIAATSEGDYQSAFEQAMDLVIAIQGLQAEQKESNFSKISTGQLIRLGSLENEAKVLKGELNAAIENFYHKEAHKEEINKHRIKVQSLKAKLEGYLVSSVKPISLETLRKDITNIQRELALIKGILATEMNDEAQKLVQEIIQLEQDAQKLTQNFERKEAERQITVFQYEWNLLKNKLETKLTELRAKPALQTREELAEISKEISESCTEISSQRAKLDLSSEARKVGQELIALRTRFEEYSEKLKEDFEANEIVALQKELEDLTAKATANSEHVDLTNLSLRATAERVDQICQETEATLSDIAALSEKIEVTLAHYEGELSESRQSRREELLKMQGENQNLESGLKKVLAKQQAQKETFAGYRFVEAKAESNLTQNVIYISEDGMCRGIDPQGKLFENVKIEFKSKVQAAQLRDPHVQREILNKLAEQGLVSYSIQQDWEFVLENLCAALNAAKESITDRNDKFHSELADVGIFYVDGQYVLKLQEAKNLGRYKDYLCDPDSLIKAAFDVTAAEERSAKLKDLHANQFSFSYLFPSGVSLTEYPDLEKALEDVQLFRVQVFDPKLKQMDQDGLIEKDRKTLEEQDSDAQAKFKEAEAKIKERKEQQQALVKVYEKQQKHMEKLTVPEETLQKEKADLEEYEGLEKEISEKGSLKENHSTERDGKITELVAMLEKVNTKNTKADEVAKKIRIEKAKIKEIEDVISQFISENDRFALRPTSLWTRFFRSSRSTELAQWIDSIRRELKEPNVDIQKIKAQLNSAAEQFQSAGNRDSGVATFQEKLKTLPVPSDDKISDLLHEQGKISFEQNKIMTKQVSELNDQIMKCEGILQKLDGEMKDLQERMDALKPSVDKIHQRQKQEQAAKEDLQYAEKLKEKEHLDSKDMQWLSNILSVLEEKSQEATRKDVPSTEDLDEADQLNLLSPVEEIQAEVSDHKKKMQDTLKTIRSVGEIAGNKENGNKSVFSACASFFAEAAKKAAKEFSMPCMGENIAAVSFHAPGHSKSQEVS